MLGDTGANGAGALARHRSRRRAPACVAGCSLSRCSTALTLASEKVSFTEVIESTPGLRELDAWGRPGADDAARPLRLRHRGGRRARSPVTTLLARVFGFARCSSSPRRWHRLRRQRLPDASTPCRTSSSRSRPGASSPPSRSRSSRTSSAPGSATGPTTRHPCCSPGPCWSWYPSRSCSGCGAGTISSGCVVTEDPRAADVATTLLRIFAVQVPLYGLGIILTGLLQAHRRFLAAALAPLASSIVVLVSYLWYGGDRRGADRTLARQRRGRAGARLGHHARRRRAARSRCVVPACAPAGAGAPRCGCRAATPGGSAPSPGPASSPWSRSRRPSWSTIWLVATVGRRRHVHRLHLRAGRLPAAVRRARRAGGHQRLPGARGPHRRGGGRHRAPWGARCAPCSCSPALSVGVLIAAAPAIGAFFSLLDARRGNGAAEHQALAALPATITAYAPGLVGFGLTALLTRALYVRGRPTDAGTRRRPGLEPGRPAAARRARRWAGPGGDAALAGHLVDAGHDGGRHRPGAARAARLGCRGDPGRGSHGGGARRGGGAGRRRRRPGHATAAPWTASPRPLLVGAAAGRRRPRRWGW